MTTRDLRIKIMKNHIWITKIASVMGVAPITVDNWLEDDELDDETKNSIDFALDEILKTWKYGEAMEKIPRGKLVKPYMIEKYRKEKAKLNERTSHEDD